MATPKKPTPASFPANDEECQKVLLAELMRAPAVVEFDNLTSDLLPHKSLCTVLTSEAFEGRILGVSKIGEVSTRTLFLSSGNNVGPVRDMARRCITINLNPKCETPAAREFKRPNLMKEVEDDRAQYVSDALTIVRAWICAGRPHTECRAVASYGVWGDFCRQPLLWLGLADPAHALFEAMMHDPDAENLARLMNYWFMLFGTKPTMVRQVIEAATQTPFNEGSQEALAAQELRELLDEIAGNGRSQINPQQLGWWLKRRLDRIVDGKRLVKAEGTRAAMALRVELV